MKLSGFAKYSWGVLIYNIGVILWGAYVRATGSGAGCGSHWPLCNGVVIPRSPQLETVIEYTHRLTSGIALLLVIGIFVWAWRSYPKGHTVRLGASLSLILIITEALVGASLVLFGWVAGDTSNGRVISMAVHLINTFLLLGALTLTAWWASGGEPLRLRGQGTALWGLGIGFAGVLILGVSGAIAALGDTLFPAQSLLEGMREDFNPAAHFLIRLRPLHPILAITVGMYLIFVSGLIGLFRSSQTIKRFSVALIVLFMVQLGAGLINLILLAPVSMQLIHLFLADAVWITLVLLAATTFASSELKVAVVESSHPGGYQPKSVKLN